MNFLGVLTVAEYKPEMFDATVKQLTRGKALRFKTLIASEKENPSDVSQ